MRDIYFDNSATTRVYPEAAELVAETMSIDYGNPSSMHTLGVRSEKYLKVSKNQIAKTLGVSDKEIYFTSGGTESNNWAIIGAAMAMRRLGNHIITSKMEHPSVSETMKYLEKQGFEVSYVGIDPDGNLNLKELEDSVKELEEELCREDVAKDHVKLAEISKALTEKKDDLDEKYESWLQLQE